MTREELRNKYEKDICSLCMATYFEYRSYPEDLCEGVHCEDAEEEYAEKNGINLED